MVGTRMRNAINRGQRGTTARMGRVWVGSWGCANLGAPSG